MFLHSYIFLTRSSVIGSGLIVNLNILEVYNAIENKDARTVPVSRNHDGRTFPVSRMPITGTITEVGLSEVNPHMDVERIRIK